MTSHASAIVIGTDEDVNSMKLNSPTSSANSAGQNSGLGDKVHRCR